MSEDNGSDDKIYEAEVIWFSKGMGFLQRKEGEADLFIHWSDIVGQEGYKILKKGQKVSYSIGTNHRGQPKAINVQVIGEKQSDK